MAMGSGTREDPWQLKTAPGTSDYTMYRDELGDPEGAVESFDQPPVVAKRWSPSLSRSLKSTS